MKKYHHCVKFTYPLSFQTRIPNDNPVRLRKHASLWGISHRNTETVIEWHILKVFAHTFFLTV